MIRTGLGYDVHQFAEGRPLVLGGVTIPHDRGLAGHSDADVLCHAIADAVLGSMGEPDIGYYFPPNDPSCEGICSLEILRKAREICDEKGGVLHNIDSTLIAEAPKILPHAAQMKERMGEVLGLPPSRIGIKATTNEKMGFLGREEGMAAMAVATIDLPDPD